MLGLYPGDSSNFYCECEKLFENLNFSDDHKHLTDEVLVSHSIKICDALCKMSRFLLPHYEAYKGSNIDFPQNFAINYGFDGGSFQGTKHNQLKVRFKVSGKQEYVEKICEPHFKFNRSDIEKRTLTDINQYCRIYFVMPQKKDKEIFIGAIRRHVD